VTLNPSEKKAPLALMIKNARNPTTVVTGAVVTMKRLDQPGVVVVTGAVVKMKRLDQPGLEPERRRLRRLH
jgi:hypothetical protein